MKILVVGEQRNGPVIRRYWPDDSSVTVVPITNIFASWDGTQLLLVRSDNFQPLNEFDCAYIIGWGKNASMARLIAFYLSQRAIPTVNGQLFDTWPVTKIAELCKLTNGGIPHPRTLCTADPRKTLKLCHWAQRTLGFELPLVVKAIGAAHGNMNFRVEQKADVIPLNLMSTYLVQEYIPNSGDYRVVIVGGRTAVVIWRSRDDDVTHLNNTAKGGEGRVVPLEEVDPEVLSLAVDAAQVMGRSDLSGVDIVIHEKTRKPYVLEVNLCPDIVAGFPDEADVAVKLAAIYCELQFRVMHKDNHYKGK